VAGHGQALGRAAGIMAGVTLSADFSAIPQDQHPARIDQLCEAMEAADAAGFYPRLTIERPWSVHNPVLEGEFASPSAIRWYLQRELGRLAAADARISIAPGRRALDLSDPDIGPAVDETRSDLRRKKLFLFGPERMALSIDRLQHYTGTPAEMFQRYVLLTNYGWHVEEFQAALPGSTGPESGGRQMPAWHYQLPGRAGLTMVNIGVGPSNAKTLTDHLAVLRPDLVLMIGHCGGLRNHQEIGDLVLATAFLRDDRVLDDVLPLSVPVVSNHTLNTLLLDELTARSLRCRMGIVFTTANRNWELQLASVAERLRLSRSVAVDMESATVAANGFRYRIPTATLLAVSDKPLHGRPKLSDDAVRFYAATRRPHVEIAIAVAQKAGQMYPGGLPTADIRSADEPLFGLTDSEPPRPPWPPRQPPVG
jgi:AMP nucleosidase